DLAEVGAEGAEQFLRHPARPQQPAALGAVFDRDPLHGQHATAPTGGYARPRMSDRSQRTRDRAVGPGSVLRLAVRDLAAHDLAAHVAPLPVLPREAAHLVQHATPGPGAIVRHELHHTVLIEQP